MVALAFISGYRLPIQRGRQVAGPLSRSRKRLDLRVVGWGPQRRWALTLYAVPPTSSATSSEPSGVTVTPPDGIDLGRLGRISLEKWNPCEVSALSFRNVVSWVPPDADQPLGDEMRLRGRRRGRSEIRCDHGSEASASTEKIRGEAWEATDDPRRGSRPARRARSRRRSRALADSCRGDRARRRRARARTPSSAG
jgi:hypothetical protein